MLAVGTRVGPYEILGLLGAGGMGEVYRVRDTRLDREVAVKVLPPPFALDPNRQARFEREAKAVAALSHPNILAVHDYGTDAGMTFLVMELLEGQSLRARLREGPLPWRKAVELAAAVAEGLAAAHSKGIVHRDLKPGNLFLSPDGRVKILDFGLARLEMPAPAEAATATYTAGQTDAGAVVGTVGYMSPEQVRGQPVDARSDIFALGCVLYQMVSGHQPFARETAADTTAAILHDDLPELSQAGKSIPIELERVIRHCLEKNPEERFQTARDLAFDLRALVSDSDLVRTSVRRSRRRIPWWGWLGAAALLLGLSAYLYFKPSPEAGPSGKGPIDSVAVLPFVNVGNDPQTEYVADGLTEGLIDGLSRLRPSQLKVMSFNAVTRYKGREVDVPAVGRDLKVRAVVTGRVHPRDGQLAVSVELVDARDYSRLGGFQYLRKTSDLLAIPGDMARDLAEPLGLPLRAEDRQRLAQRSTENREAYRLYQLGRFHWNRRSREGFFKGLEYFGQAIGHDPDFALAYAGLADSYTLLANYGLVSPQEAFPRAKAEARRALAIDPKLAAAHTSLAWAAYIFDWDWKAAEDRFQQAIELDPSYVTAHHWYADFLTAMGRHAEALASIHRALDRDPLSLIINRDVAWNHYFARDYDRALAQLQKTLEMDPAFVPAHSLLGRVYLQKELYAEAIATFQKVLDLPGGHVSYREMLGQAYALAGRHQEARQVLQQLDSLREQTYVSPYYRGLIHLGLGERDQALTWLAKAHKEQATPMVYLKVDPAWDALRAEPRFKDLLGRMRFP